MKRLVNLKDVESLIHRLQYGEISFDTAYDMLDNMQSHAHWIYDAHAFGYFYPGYVCSNCGHATPSD